MSNVKTVCDAIDDWARRMIEAKLVRVSKESAREFETAWREVRLGIRKSCLLDRVLYKGEQPSQTPCPVHKGIWTGVHGPWPGQRWRQSDGSTFAAVPSEQCQEWYDAGCRCFMHKCGCTTGWQPDEHCGCGAK